MRSGRSSPPRPTASLQCKNVNADYVKAFWNVVNWADVSNRFAVATAKTNNVIVV